MTAADEPGPASTCRRGPTRSTASGRSPPRRCSASTPTGTASPASPCGSAASASGRNPRASWRPGCRYADCVAHGRGRADGRARRAPGRSTAISANRDAWWDLEPGARIGYHPRDDAAAFENAIPSPPRTKRGARASAVRTPPRRTRDARSTDSRPRGPEDPDDRVPEDLRASASDAGSPTTRTPTRAHELADLVAAAEDDDAARAELADRFDGRLEFGTAGLRGEIAAGPNRMNRAVVIRAAAGLAGLLRETRRPRHGGDRLRRPAPVRRVRPRHREVMRGAGLDAVLLPAAAADPAAGLRDRPPRLHRRRHGDGVAQPAARQRLQGLPRRRQPDRAAGRRRDLRADRRRRGGRRRAARRRLARARRGHRRRLRRRRRRPGGRRTPRATSRSSTRRCTASATRPSRTSARAGRVRAADRRARAGGARPRLPDRVVPEPGGAGRDGSGHGARRAPRRRHRGRQRPRRRPVRRRRADDAGLADAARRRGRRAARRPPAAPRRPRRVRDDHRVVVAARHDGCRATASTTSRR